jgi:hypothetical protein
MAYKGEKVKQLPEVVADYGENLAVAHCQYYDSFVSPP